VQQHFVPAAGLGAKPPRRLEDDTGGRFPPENFPRSPKKNLRFTDQLGRWRHDAHGARMWLPIRLLVALATTLCLIPAALASAQGFTVGISEQKLGVWQDPRFEELGVRQARLLVYYNQALSGDFGAYDQWMAAARARGVDVLVVINRASDSSTRLPTTHEYRRVVRAIRARWPWVTTMGAWNEANHRDQPTARRPERAARYYNVMRQECLGCRIVAADVLDSRGMSRWVRRFMRHAHHPRLWGLHNYGDVNRQLRWGNSGTRKLLRIVRGRVWLPETGGIVRFADRYRGGRGDELRAARAVAWAFRFARRSARIRRVYLYEWSADPVFQAWDSGLVAADGRARPGLAVLRRQLNRQRRRAARQPVPPLPAYPQSVLPLP
jgi:hypothetical protein